MSRTSVVFAFLATLTLCGATLQIAATFIAGMSVATNHTALRPYSEIQCAAKCFDEGRYNRCRVAGYSRETHTCYLSLDNLQDVTDIADQNVGVFIMQGRWNRSVIQCSYFALYVHFYHVIVRCIYSKLNLKRL